MDESFLRNFCDFCQLCLSQNHELHRIFTPSGAPNQLLIMKLEYCTGIKVSFSADSNASICAKCINLTENLFRFKQLCVANDQWLKMDAGSVDNDSIEDFLGKIIPSTVTEDRLAKADSCASLLTIGTEQHEDEFPDCGEEQQTQETAEAASTDESTGDSSLRPSIKVTIQLTPEMKCFQKSSSAFSLIPGTKSRADRLYLLYKGYHYSDYQSKKNVYRCTQRTPVYCRAKVLLRNDRVYEMNNNYHDHPLPRKSTRRLEIC